MWIVQVIVLASIGRDTIAVILNTAQELVHWRDYGNVTLVWYSNIRDNQSDLDMSVQVFIASDKKGLYTIKVDHILYNPLSSNYK